MSYENTHGSGTKLLCASSALGRGQHQKQLGYLVWRQVIIQKEEIHTCAFIGTRKKISRKMKNVSYSHINI